MRELIIAAASRYALDPAIVYGVCMAESGMDFHATRYEPGYRWVIPSTPLKPRLCSMDTEVMMQRTSWGLMQTMGALLREQGYPGWLNAISCDPVAQLDHGCKYLAGRIALFGPIEGVAAYNSGTPRKVDGTLINQVYVDRVMAFSKEWKP